MSSKRPAHVELKTSEVETLRIGVQQTIAECQAFSLDAMRSMLVEIKRDKGRSESGSAEGSDAVRESPEETSLSDGGLQNFGEMGLTEAAVPVEVGPDRG